MKSITRKFLLGCTSATAIIACAAPALAQETMETVVVTGIRASLQSAQSIKQNSDQVVDSITAVDIGALPDRNIAEALQRVPGVTVQRNDAPNDLVRMGSTGNSVFVRGLSWVKTLVNGRDEFTAVNGRQLSFADVSADLMQAVNVYKSPTAGQIEGGVGGTINLVTRKPFDQDGLKLAVSGDITYGNLIDRARPSGNALISDRWNTHIGEIGILASVDWQDQMNRTEGFNVGTFDCWNVTSGSRFSAVDSGYNACTATPLGNAAGSHVFGPNGWAWRQMEWHQQRLATNVVLQWRPSDKLEFTVFAMNTYARSTDMEHYVWNPINSTQEFAGTFDSKSNWTGGQSTTTSLDTRAGSGHNRNTDISLNIKYTPTEKLTVEADAQVVESASPYKNVTYFTGLNASLNPVLDIRGDTPKVTWTDPTGALSKAGNYYWLAAMDHSQYNVAHAVNARIDADYAFGGNGLFGYVKSVDAGFRTEQKLAVSRGNGYNWGGVSWNWYEQCLPHAPWSDSTCQNSNVRFPALDGTLQGPGAALGWYGHDGNIYPAVTGALANAMKYAELFHYNTLFGNKLPGLWVPSTTIGFMNTVAAYKILLPAEPADNVVPSWGPGDQTWSRWVPYAAEHGCTGDDTTCLAAYATSPGSASTGSRSSRQFEDTYAAYFQANFAHDTFLGYDIPIDGNAGLRIVRTNDEINAGLLVMPYLSQTHCTLPADPAHPVAGVESISCTDWNNALAFLGGTANQGTTIARPAVKSGYTNYLPSFNFRAHVTDQIQARLAYSETIVRPDFGFTNTSASLSFNWYDQQSTQYGMFKNDPSGYGGNPYLKPMHATNYDVSIEYYPSPSTSLTFSMFHKDLSNYVFTATTKMPITDPVSHQTMIFNYTTYVNGDKGKVEGFELAYQQFFDQLPGVWSGLGVQGNYTKIYNSGGHNGPVYLGNSTAIANSNNKALPLEGMSNDSYNVALMYSKYNIDARLAWNWRSRYLSSSSAANANQPAWVANYGQLDGSVFYTLFEHYKLGFQLYNITGNNFYTDIGYPDFHPRTNWIKSDRKYSFVVRASW